MVEKLVMTVEEVATALGLSRSSTYEGVRTGEIPSIRIGHRLLIPREQLLRKFGATAPAEADAASEA